MALASRSSSVVAPILVALVSIPLQAGQHPRPFPRHGPAERPVVRLAWNDPARVAVAIQPQVCREVEVALRSLGVPVRWRTSHRREAARPGEVRIILLDRPAVRAEGLPVLGITHRQPSSTPAVWIHVPCVRQTLGLAAGGPGEASPQAQETLARALGRVIAHEVVHVVAPEVPHGTGLMSAAFSRESLLAPDMAVGPEVVAAVLASLSGGGGFPRRVLPLPPASSRREEAALGEPPLP